MLSAKRMIVAAVLFLAACSTQTEIVNIDANTKGYHITCDSTPPFATYKDCTERAAMICGNMGYIILKQDDSPMGGSTSPMGGLWSISSREMLIKCNAPASYVPDTYSVPQ